MLHVDGSGMRVRYQRDDGGGYDEFSRGLDHGHVEFCGEGLGHE